MGKEEKELSLFAYAMTVYKGILKESTTTTTKNLELIRNYSKVAGYKVNIQSLLLSFIPAIKKLKLEIKKYKTIYISTYK